MRMAIEASDNVAMAARLRCRMRIELLQMLRRLAGESFTKRNAALEQRDLLRVAKGKHKEGLLPYGCQLSVVSALEAIDGEAEGPAVLRECLRGIAVDRSRELIEHEDERQSRARRVPPAVKFALTG